MFDQIFGSGDYYDFPSFEVALFSLLLSFVLSTVIGIVYRITFEGDRFPNHFFQAIVLSSMVSCMVIMAVGNNLAAGFGIIGAIAIIRFRTLIRDPRNIIFIFGSLSVGIATGVYGYAIALSGTLIFSVVALLLHYSPYGLTTKEYYDLTVGVGSEEDLNPLKDFLSSKNIRYKIIRVRQDSVESQRGYRYTLQIILKEKVEVQELFRQVNQLSTFSELRITPSEDVQL